MSSQPPPKIHLFGYDSSTFTLKVRLALKLKQLPYTFTPVPTMLPRPQITENFNITYRKIPILAIGRDIYCDTSIILEALEHFFPQTRSLYPVAEDGRDYRGLIRGFASYWTDRPLFRVTTGLMPASIWASAFGRDREELIGHRIDAEKLGRKVPENLSRMDLQLSLVEPLFEKGGFIFSTAEPSLADLSLYYQLDWGNDISSGGLTSHITQGEAENMGVEGMNSVFNAQRYPGVYTWFKRMKRYFENLPSTEEKCENFNEVVKQMRDASDLDQKSLLLPTPAAPHKELDTRNGLVEGASVSVVPDDTGRDDPTFGTLVALSPEEVVIKPRKLDPPATVGVRVHFPRLGFVVRPVPSSKL